MLEETLSAEQFAAVPEKARDYYRQDGDKYVLDVVPRSVNHSTLENKRKAEAEAEALRRRYDGLDPDVARKAIEAAKLAEQERALKAGEFEKVLGQTKAEYEAAQMKLKAEYEAKLSETNGILATKLRDEELLRAAIAAGVQSEFHDDVLLHGKEAFEVKDGKLVPKGHTHDSVEKWLKDKLSKKKGWLGASTGGGTSKGGATGAATTGQTRASMNLQQKAEFIREHGRKAYEALPPK